jgi:hypothetical protein
LAEIDRFAHLMRLLCAGTGKRTRRFGPAIKALRNGEPVENVVAAFQLTREEIRSIAFHMKDLHKRNPKVCKLLLLRLSDEISGMVTAADPSSYSIEHVLPQRPSATSEWRSWFPTPDVRARCTESLGNLVLITQAQNDRARNASFATKREIYAAASAFTPLLPVTRDILDLDVWTPEVVIAREQKLIAAIEDMWRIDLDSARQSAA